MKQKVSKHFTYDEFECKCGCGTMQIDAQFLQSLEQLRELIGVPIHVTSGYRCPEHPETIKRPNSYHVQGMAADIYAPDMDLLDLYFAAERIGNFRNGGIGLYTYHPQLGKPGFIHTDIRQQYARWGHITRYGGDVGIYTSLVSSVRYHLEPH